MPLPNEEETPPVTKMYFVAAIGGMCVTGFKVTNYLRKSGVLQGKFFPDPGQHLLQAVFLYLKNYLQVLPEFSGGKALSPEPDQVRERQFEQQPPPVLPERHPVVGEFDEFLPRGVWTVHST